MDDLLIKLKEKYADLYANYKIENGATNFDINHFNERLTISLASLPGFDSNIIESEAYRSSLKQSFLLNDFWFVYETLLKSNNSIRNKNYDIYSIALEYESSKYKTELNNVLKESVSQLLNVSKFKLFLETLLKKCNGKLNKKIQIIIDKINSNKKFDIEDLTAITYAVRNVFVHEGRIHFKGLSISSVKDITSILLKNLKIIIYIIAISKLF